MTGHDSSKINEINVRQEIRGSDHAPLCVTVNIENADLIASSLLERAKNLGQSYCYPKSVQKRTQRTIPSKNVNVENFREYMANHHPPVLTADDLDSALNTSLGIIKEGAKSAKVETADTGVGN